MLLSKLFFGRDMKVFLHLTGFLIGFSSPTAKAAYLEPPDWDPMVMLGVYYDSGSKTLSVDSEIDGISYGYSYYDSTGTKISGSGGKYASLDAPSSTYNSATHSYNLSYEAFDPTAKWSVLNGTAYSRQLGWYDWDSDNFSASHSSDLPDNAYVWIEKIAGSDTLKTYTVSEDGNPTEPYTPIFGTDGSSTKWKWDGFMDHNVYAVDLKDITQDNQTFYATYYLYIGDANGNALDGYTGTTTTWTWQWYGPAAVPEPMTLLLAASGIPLYFRKKWN